MTNSSLLSKMYFKNFESIFLTGVMGDLNIVETDFPIYLVQYLSAENFLIAGGGGHAKTGVSNAIVGIVYYVFMLNFHYFILGDL